MRWWTSDLHLGHANIIGYCHRPFPDVAAMDQGLVAQWNDTVADDDVVWVLGDFALGRLPEVLPLTARLRGSKVLVPGNHDPCWAGRSKGVARWTAAYLDAGFDRVVQGPTAVELAGRSVRVDHFPYRGDSQDGAERYAEHRPRDDGRWILHGHVHDRWRQSGRQVNVGVDAWGGRPVSDDTLAELLAAGPAERPPAPWGQAPGWGAAAVCGKLQR
jgi:calcineurin-like phosphoesterase family protein